MLKNKVIISLSIFLLFFQLSFAQKKLDSSFIGMWVNSQYNFFHDSTSNMNVLNSISPQFINIDSKGLCTLFLRYEQKSIIGKPIKVKTFGVIQELTYKKNYIFYLSFIKGEKKFIVLSFPDNPCNVVFIRR